MFFDGEKATVSNSRVSCIQSSQAAVLSALIFNLLQIKPLILAGELSGRGFGDDGVWDLCEGSES